MQEKQGFRVPFERIINVTETNKKIKAHLSKSRHIRQILADFSNSWNSSRCTYILTYRKSSVQLETMRIGRKNCTVFTEELVNGELEKDKMLKAEVPACRKVTTVPPRLNAVSTKTIILLTTMVQNPGV